MRPTRLAMTLAFLVLCLVNFPASALGGLIVSADPLVLGTSGPSSTGRITLTIRSDNGTDLLDAFGLELRLTSTNNRYISFVNPSVDAQLGNSSYIFHGDSVGEVDGPPGGLVSSVVNPNDTYIGGDGTLSGAGVAVPTLDPLNTKILIQVDITSLTSSAPLDGDVFFLTLVGGASTFFSGSIPPLGGLPPSLDVLFAEIPISITAVPEPASVLGAGFGGVALALALLRRRGV